MNVADFGPHERLARGEVRIEGDGRARRGRVISVISTFGRAEREAAAWLEMKFEAAEWQGFHCSKLDRGGGGGPSNGQTDRAAAARLALWKISSHIGPKYWNVIFHVLLFMEPQSQYAIRAGIRKMEVRPLLQAALCAVADYRRG